MRYSFAILTCVVLFSYTACNNKSDHDIPAELKEAMQARLEAVWKKDTAIWGRLTADEFTVVVPDGSILTKKDRMVALRTERPQPKHDIQHEQILTQGETVVRRFIDENEWVLEVWSNRSGRWKALRPRLTTFISRIANRFLLKKPTAANIGDRCTTNSKKIPFKKKLYQLIWSSDNDFW